MQNYYTNIKMQIRPNSYLYVIPRNVQRNKRYIVFFRSLLQIHRLFRQDTDIIYMCRMY